MYPNWYFWFENMPSGNPVTQTFFCSNSSSSELGTNSAVFREISKVAKLFPRRLGLLYKRRLSRNFPPTLHWLGFYFARRLEKRF
jgi:hypothetical protein